jgi:hypothetical protein
LQQRFGGIQELSRGGIVYAQDGRYIDPNRRDPITGQPMIADMMESTLGQKPNLPAQRKVTVDSALERLSTGLGTAGMIPGLGEPFDLAAAGVDALRGDYTGAGLSLASMIPFFGMGAGATKLARRASGGLDLSKALAARRRVNKVEFNRGTDLVTKSNLEDVPVGGDVSQIMRGVEGAYMRGRNTMFVPSDAGSGLSKLAAPQSVRRHETLHAILANDPSAVNTPFANLTKRLRGTESSLGDAASVLTEELAAFATDKNPAMRIMGQIATPFAYLPEAVGKFLSSRKARQTRKQFPFMGKYEAFPTVNKSTGGIVYANNGMLVPYRPKGTDTVPAMLTPGEFVVNRAATQQHLPALQAMNRGGKVSYLENGTPGTNALDTSLNNLVKSINPLISTLTNFGRALQQSQQNIPTGTQATNNNNGVNTNGIQQFTTALNSVLTQLQNINIPSQINITAQHAVDVRILGGDVFAQLEPGIRDMIVNETAAQIRKFGLDNFDNIV